MSSFLSHISPKTINTRASKGFSATLKTLDLVDDASTVEVLSQKQLEAECLAELRDFCDDLDEHISDDLIFRFACYHQFDTDKAQDAINQCFGSDRVRFSCFHRFDGDASQRAVRTCFGSDRIRRYLGNLTMDRDQVQELLKGIALPLFGLRTKDNAQVIYLRCLPFHPSPQNLDSLLQLLSYLLNDMSQTEDDCRNGVALLVNAEGYSTKSSSIDALVYALQGMQNQFVPTRIPQIYFLEASSQFVKSWKSPNIPRRGGKDSEKHHATADAHFLKSSEKLSKHLVEGYQQYLPDEIPGGCRDMSEMIEDFIDQKRYDERRQVMQSLKD